MKAIKKTKKANLERKRVLFFEIGIISALLIVFLAFQYRVYDVKNYRTVVDKSVEVTDELIPVTIQKPPLPPPPPIIATNINEVKNDVQTEPTPVIDASADVNTVVPEPVLDLPDDNPVIDDTPTAFPQQKPEFPGGLNALYSFIAKNIIYPPSAKAYNTQGTVYVNFIVEKDGSISTVTVLRGIGNGCDEEAVRVVSLLPDWIPGRQMDRPVRVSFNLSVKFTLY